jgi:hypothetical protein
MKIAKFQPDEEGILRVPQCIATLWVGMQHDVPTMLAIVAGEGEPIGKNLTFYIKLVGDNTDFTEMKQFAAALVTADSEFLLFGDKPVLVQSPNGAGPSVPPGMAGRTFETK